MQGPHTADGRLTRIPGDEPDDIEPAQIARYSNGVVRISLREDVEDDVAKKVAALDPAQAFERPDIVVEAFGGAAVAWDRMTSYVCPDSLSKHSDVVRMMPDAKRAADYGVSVQRPLFGLLLDREPVSYSLEIREPA